MLFKSLQGLLTLPVVKYGPPPETPSVVPLYGVPVSVTPAPMPGGILSLSTETLLALIAAILLAMLGGYVLLRMLLAGKK